MRVLAEKLLAVLNSQLPASGINIFTTAAAYVGVYPLFAQMIGKGLNFILAGIRIGSKCDRVILDDIYLTRQVFTKTSQFIGIRDIIIKAIENNILVGYRVLGFGVVVF